MAFTEINIKDASGKNKKVKLQPYYQASGTIDRLIDNYAKPTVFIPNERYDKNTYNQLMEIRKKGKLDELKNELRKNKDNSEDQVVFNDTEGQHTIYGYKYTGDDGNVYLKTKNGEIYNLGPYNKQGAFKLTTDIKNPDNIKDESNKYIISQEQLQKPLLVKSGTQGQTSGVGTKETTKNKAEQYSLDNISELPPEYRNLYIQLSQGENRPFDLKTAPLLYQTTDPGSQIAQSAIEGFAEGFLPGINKAITARSGQEHFEKNIVPILERVYGKKFTGKNPSDVMEINTQIENLNKDNTLSPQEKQIKIDQLKQSYQTIPEKFVSGFGTMTPEEEDLIKMYRMQSGIRGETAEQLQQLKNIQQEKNIWERAEANAQARQKYGNNPNAPVTLQDLMLILDKVK